MAAAGAWGSPAAGGGGDDGGEWSFPDADEAVTAAGVTLRLPAAALDDLPSLAPVLSMRTCVARAAAPQPACARIADEGAALRCDSPVATAAGARR